MAKNRGIDWGRFIDIGSPRAYGGDPDKVSPATADMKRRLQFAYRIDTSVVTPLSLLPQAVASDPPPSLAQRNLLRGFELGLPTGQSVAKAMGVKPLTDVRLSSARRSTSRAPTMSLGLSPSCRNSPPSGVSARYGPTSSPKPQGRSDGQRPRHPGDYNLHPTARPCRWAHRRRGLPRHALRR
jgi:hypothetical protein